MKAAQKKRRSSKAPDARADAMERGKEVFGKLGLSEPERERLASIGRLSILSADVQAAPAFIRLQSDSTTQGETDAELGRVAEGDPRFR